jgi:F-type H+-transporting ATPase subunit b
MLGMAEFWVAVAFVVFVAILVYYKVPALIAKALDDRAEAIRKELDEARRLREEAQNLLADYQKKHRNVGQEAEAIVDQARREAEALAQETRASLKTTLERRTKLAEDKIARAEADAVREVRSVAVDAAVAAAQALIAANLTPDRAEKLVSESIDTLKSKLN